MTYKRDIGRSGLTLIEILIALTMTLIVLGAMMTAFQFASEKMQLGRAMMELANRTRTAESLMRSNLANLTVEARPHAQTSSPNGFLEIIEGLRHDDSSRFANTNVLSAPSDGPVINPIDAYLGDVDDSIGMTVRNAERPFRGRSTLPVTGPVIESSLAEVWWFVTFTNLSGDQNIDGTPIDFEDSVTVRRRALLIRPDLGLLLTDPDITVVNAFIAANDISCRVVQVPVGTTGFTYNVIANNLADLAVRRNRFCHEINTLTTNNFPNELDPALLDPTAVSSRLASNGHDMLLTDVCGFDLRVYSPNAAVNSSDMDGDGVVDPSDTGVDVIVGPGDPGYLVSDGGDAGTEIDPATFVRLGAFVDLGYGRFFGGTTDTDSDGWFAGSVSSSVGGLYGGGNVYDTWTPFYESDGIDQFGDGSTDEGTDGLDTDGVNGVDDTAERETLPPYARPVRGLQVQFRLIEKNTKQVHQTTIVQSFVPE